MGKRRREAHPPSGLDPRSTEVLDFESPSRYHQLLHRIIDRPEALVYDPMLVRRLRRVREVRRRARTASGLGLRV
jgi:hypothetical protein